MFISRLPIITILSCPTEKGILAQDFYLINLFVVYAIVRIRSSSYPQNLHLSRILGTLLSKILLPFLDLVVCWVASLSIPVLSCLHKKKVTIFIVINYSFPSDLEWPFLTINEKGIKGCSVKSGQAEMPDRETERRNWT